MSGLADARARAAQLVRDADSLGAYLLTAAVEPTEAAIRKLTEELALGFAIDHADVAQRRHLDGRRPRVLLFADLGDAPLEAPPFIAGASAAVDDAFPSRAEELRREHEQRAERDERTDSRKQREQR
jgi:hypothetical protein